MMSIKIELKGKEENLPKESGYYEAEFTNGGSMKLYYNSTSEASMEFWIINVLYYYV